MLFPSFMLAMAVAQGPADWYEPFPAHKVIGNVYYVGSKDLATYLIATPEGHVLINSGFFALRREIFDYMRPGDELVLAPFARLIAEKRLLGYQCPRFWCMDTFKEQQELTDLANSGRAPWEGSTWRSGTSLLRSSGPATPSCGATWWVNSTQRVIAPAILSP